MDMEGGDQQHHGDQNQSETCLVTHVLVLTRAGARQPRGISPLAPVLRGEGNWCAALCMVPVNFSAF
jgi:hypothetical protein